MFKYYTSGEYRKSYCVLEVLQILSANKHTLLYSDISQQFILNNNHNTFLISCLEIMSKQKITSEKSIKFISFLHCAIQNSNIGNLSKTLMPFFSYLLKLSQDVIKKESIKSFPHFTTDSLISGQKSPIGTQTIRTSNRQNSDKLSKELYLNMHIVKPYLTYLFKILSIEDFYNECKQSKMRVDFNEAWVLVNVLKLLQAVTKNFQHVGRYYYKQYQSVVVMLTECFSRDVDVLFTVIQRFYPKIKYLLAESVKTIEYKFSVLSEKHGKLHVYDNLDIDNIDETVKMLDQISCLNESLFPLYMNKYFFSKIQHIQPPTWIETTDKEFDFVFHLWKIKNKVETERVRRGLKKNQSLFQKVKTDGSKIDISRIDTSISFMKRVQIPQYSFKNRGTEVTKPFTIS